jgi:hypothetical protein
MFAVPLGKTSLVPALATLDVVAEAAVKQSAVHFKSGQFFVKVPRIQSRVFGALEPFQSSNRIVNSSVHQRNCFVNMGLLHDIIPFSGVAASSTVN